MQFWRLLSPNAGITIAILLATLALYLPSTQYGFIRFDDPLYVSENTHVQAGLTKAGALWAFSTTKGGSWHPITWLSYMATCQIFGAGPAPQRFFNILLHAASSALVFGLLRRLTGAPWRSALAAAVFALHPLHVESVVWIAERKDVLSTAFFLLSLLAYSKYATAKRASFGGTPKSWYALVLLFLLLGLMSKPTLVTFPFVCLLLDFWPLSRMPDVPRRFRLGPYLPLLREKVPLFFLTFAFSLLVMWSQAREGAMKHPPLSGRLSNAMVSYCRYLGKSLWPQDLCIYYPRPPGSWGLATAIAATIFLAAVCVLAVRGRKRFPFVFTGWFWFLGTLVPVIGLVQIGGQAMADRYMYLPMIGLAIVFAWGPGCLASSGLWAKSAATGCGLIVCGAWFLQSQAQIWLWRNPEVLFSHAAAVTKRNPVAHLNLALYYQALGHTNTAERFYRKTLAAMPNSVEAHNNLGRILADRGETKAALTQYEQALHLDPRASAVHHNLGLLLLSSHQTNEAAAQFSQAIALGPESSQPYANLGVIRAQQGRLQEAITLFRNAVKWDPSFAENNFNLALALRRSGHASEGAHYLYAAVRLRPNYGKAHYELGLLLADQKKVSEAEAHLETAVTQGVEVQKALDHLASLALDSGNTQKAIRAYRRLIEAAPNSMSALNDLAWLLATCRDAEYRNGAEAIMLAQRAVALSKADPEHALDTLAAAYAESGDFNRAIDVARAALTAARQRSNSTGVQNMEKRLRLYEAHEPYRE